MVELLRPPRGHQFLFTQVWVTGGGSSFDENRPPSYEDGFELWANSPCSHNEQPYDPFCLTTLPAEHLMRSVPANWLTNGHVWLQPDRYWLQHSSESTWSSKSDSSSCDFPMVVGLTAHGAVDMAVDCADTQSKTANASNHFLHNSDAEFASKIVSIYASNASAASHYSMISLLTDSQLTCPLWQLALTADHVFTSGVYFYIASYQHLQTCGNNNQPSLQLADGMSDISAILGHYHVHQSPSDAEYVDNMQSLFYNFVVDGSLPGATRASAGYYDVQLKTRQKTMASHSLCQQWQESGNLRHLTRRA